MSHWLPLWLVLLSAPAVAQTGTPTRQSGSVTPGHVTAWSTNGVIQDGGTAYQGFLTSLGVTAAGPGICQRSASTGAYNRICLNVTQTGGGSLNVDNIGGATGGFSFVLNGAAQGIPTITLPVTASDPVCFADTTGTLKDCGTSGGLTGISDLATCMNKQYGSGGWSYWIGAGTGTDTEPAIDACLQTIRTNYGRGVLWVSGGLWSLKNPVPSADLAGNQIWGVGSQGSKFVIASTFPGTVIWKFTGEGGYSGGGLSGLAVLLEAGMGTTSLDFMDLKGDATYQPDQMSFNDLYITQVAGSASYYAKCFDVDGSAKSTGAQGVRVGNWNNIQCFNNSVGSEFKNAINFTVANLGTFSPSPASGGDVHVTGGGSPGSTNTTDFACILCTISGRLYIDNSDVVAFTGAKATNATFATTATNVTGSFTISNPVSGSLGNGSDVTVSGVQTIFNNIGANVSSDGLVLQNSTAASAGNTQMSPRLRLTGQGWATSGSSQETDWIIESLPVQGAANPTVNLSFGMQVNGGGYTYPMKLTSTGQLQLFGGTGTPPLLAFMDGSTYITFESNAGTNTTIGFAAYPRDGGGVLTHVGYLLFNDSQTMIYGTGAAAATLSLTGSTQAVSGPGSLTMLSGTSIPAGGTTGAGLMVSSTADFGIFFGSGPPTLAAAKGSLYLRSDGDSTHRAYINTDGNTTWTTITTAG